MSGFAITDLHKGFGSHPVLRQLNMEAPAATFTAILGASGSGKTTLLRLLAGFERPDQGTIRIGERVVDARGHHVRPELRRIGYVPQEGSLFPHLTVEANVGFGLARKQRRRRTSELLELVGLSEMRSRFPHQLSGGQQQRVALARALAVKPEIVLLDEPFASLDAHLRISVREEVRAILREAGATAVLVTHDQEEALSLADLVAVLRDGTIVQHATPYDMYTMPADQGIASFVGDANLIHGTLDGASVETPLGRLHTSYHGTRPTAKLPVTALIRPEQISIHQDSVGDRLTGRITRTGYLGHDMIVHLEMAGTADVPRLIARIASDARCTVGARVGIDIDGPVLVWPREAAPDTASAPPRLDVDARLEACAASGQGLPLVTRVPERA